MSGEDTNEWDFSLNCYLPAQSLLIGENLMREGMAMASEDGRCNECMENGLMEATTPMAATISSGRGGKACCCLWRWPRVGEGHKVGRAGWRRAAGLLPRFTRSPLGLP